jgi:hypothetical protein
VKVLSWIAICGVVRSSRERRGSGRLDLFSSIPCEVNPADASFEILAYESCYIVIHYVMALAAAFGLFAALYASVGKTSGDNIPNGLASFTAAAMKPLCLWAGEQSSAIFARSPVQMVIHVVDALVPSWMDG